MISFNGAKEIAKDKDKDVMASFVMLLILVIILACVLLSGEERDLKPLYAGHCESSSVVGSGLVENYTSKNEPFMVLFCEDGTVEWGK